MLFEIGLKCPLCQRVYKAVFDTEKQFEVGKGCPGGATTLHCPKCTKLHPALIILSKYQMVEFRGVEKYPVETIEAPRILKMSRVMVGGT